MSPHASACSGTWLQTPRLLAAPCIISAMASCNSPTSQRRRLFRCHFPSRRLRGAAVVFGAGLGRATPASSRHASASLQRRLIGLVPGLDVQHQPRRAVFRRLRGGAVVVGSAPGLDVQHQPHRAALRRLRGGAVVFGSVTCIVGLVVAGCAFVVTSLASPSSTCSYSTAATQTDDDSASISAHACLQYASLISWW